MMTPSHDPDGGDQTLLPGSPAKAPAAEPPPRARPTPAEHGTPSHPTASDATLYLPPAPSIPTEDPGATLDYSTRPGASTETHSDGNGGVADTLLPSSTHAGGTEGTLVDNVAAAGLTLPLPDGQTLLSGESPTSELSGDTAPVSISVESSSKPKPSPSATGTMVGRFTLKDLHASGGLGEVFTARDTELNREVAVKRIKSHYADDAGSRRRFLTEAQLTAKLDHPGVVPVFGLVNDVRGRPCYAMRFIRGETLKDEIDRYYNQGLEAKRSGEKTEKSGEKLPGSTDRTLTSSSVNVPRSVAFRHLLARFLAACQAIAYAHSRNIIHRDIKPANIMVGAFGETLVVDWGLAKSLDDGPDFDRMMKSASAVGFRHDPEATDLPSHMTMAGTAVGTPAYMAPEQAAGEIEKVGIRADIYSLGATLFVILTGKAPVVGKNAVEILDRVRRGYYEPMAKVNPDCPKPLDAIAHKAMALRPEDRYASALELAADVERWLSDEPVSCYQDPFFARLARWARRHPARVATGVSLLLAGVLAIGGIAWAVNEGRKNTEKALKLVTAEEQKKKEALEALQESQKQTLAANRQLETQNQVIQDEKQKVETARNAARKRYEKAVAAYNTLVYDIDKKMTDRAGLQSLRKTLLSNAIDGLKQLVEGREEGLIAADRTLVSAYRQMGEVYQLIGDTTNARKSFENAVTLAEEVQRESLPADKRAADRDLGRSFDKLAGIQLQAGRTEAALEAVNKAITLFEDLAKDKADTEVQKDLAGAKARRAAILTERGKTGKALEDCNDALTTRQRLSEAAPQDLDRKSDLAASLDALTDLQLRTGGTKNALTNAETSLIIRKELAKQLSDRTDAARELAGAYARLGAVQTERGHITDAKKTYLEGLDKLKKLASTDEQSVNTKADLAAMYGRLGQISLRTGDLENALESTQSGLKLALHLHQLDPHSAKAQRDLALAREQYGDALLAIGRTDDGIAEYETAKKILGPLREKDKESTRAKLDLARSLERLGDGFMAKNNVTGAIVVFDRSVEIREDVSRTDTGSLSAKRDLAMSLYKLANAYSGSNKPGKADQYATHATNLFMELVSKDPDSAQAQRNIALSYAKWGQILANNGHATGALIVWQSSLDHCEKLVNLDTGNMQAKEDEAAAWERLANFYAVLGHTDRAISSARTAVELWTTIGNSSDVKTKTGRYRLALAMLRCGDINAEIRQLKAAREWYNKAAKEIEGFPSDPLLSPVAKRAADQQLCMDAIEVGLRNPFDVRTFPKNVQASALLRVAKLELRENHPVNASVAARELAKIATTSSDTFAIAGIFAGCAASSRPTAEEIRKSYASDALKYLKLAIDSGFHDTEALLAPEWDAVRTRAPEFDKLQAALEKKVRGEE